MYVVYLGQNGNKYGQQAIAVAPKNGKSTITIAIGPIYFGTANQLLVYSAITPGVNEMGPVVYSFVDVIGKFFILVYMY